MTGLLGGGHAIYFDAASGEARNLDCFCAVPGSARPRATPSSCTWTCRSASRSCTTRSGRRRVRCPACLRGSTRCGRRTAACRGRGSSSRRCSSRGTALRCRRRTCLSRDARAGDDVARRRAHVRARREAAPDGRAARAPGLVHALESLADEGAASAYTGAIARALLELIGRTRRTRDRGGSARVRGGLERAG